MENNIKEISDEDNFLFKVCLDFTGNINEMMNLEEENEINHYNEEIIYIFKN